MTNLSNRLAAAFLLVIMGVGTANGEERLSTPLVISAHAIQQGVQATPPRSFAVPRQRASSAHSGRRVAWTALGAVGGFFGGAFLGAKIDRALHDCNCDDPGFQGFLIGMPVGAIAGGVAGFVLSK
jgi:hypothetical protein